jgi:hypothetical protein
LGLFLRYGKDAPFVLNFIFSKEKLFERHAMELWPSLDDARVLSGESVSLPNTRTFCRFETMFVDYFFKLYKVMFRIPMQLSKLRARRVPKVRLADFWSKSIKFARRMWWRHSAIGPDIVDGPM